MLDLKTTLAYKWKNWPKGVQYITQHHDGFLVAHMVSGANRSFTKKVFEVEEGFIMYKKDFEILKAHSCVGQLATLPGFVTEALYNAVEKLKNDQPLLSANNEYLLYHIAFLHHLILEVVPDKNSRSEAQKQYARNRKQALRNIEIERRALLPDVDKQEPHNLDKGTAASKSVDAPVPTGSPLVHLVAKNVPMWPVSASGDDGYVWQDEQGVLMVSYSAVESEPVQYAYHRMLSMPGEPRALELAYNRVVNDAVVYIDKASWLAEHDRMAQDLEAVRKEAGAMKIDK